MLNILFFGRFKGTESAGTDRKDIDGRRFLCYFIHIQVSGQGVPDGLERLNGEF